MAGHFILSLDCEGKWGIADQLDESQHDLLKDDRLHDVYSSIAELLDRLGIAATFAFTECFLLSRDELLSLPIEELTERLPYARIPFADLREGSRQGWSAPWARELIGDRHEIGSHGVTHTPWGQMDGEQARYEMSLLNRRTGQTFVYPRNQLAHVELLRELGFKGYRLPPPPRARFFSLLSEFNLLLPAEADPPPEPLQPIPGGYFVNWLSGARRIVPPAWTRARARHALEQAARHGGVAHFWMHPENVATAPATMANLSAILEEVSDFRRAGRIEVLTQADYCDLLSGRPALVSSREASPG